MTDKLYTIDEVTERLDVTSRTLHYYEEIGLIPEVRRTEGGHRLYKEETVQQVEHILRLKYVLGYSLQEIKNVLQAEQELDELRHSFEQEPSGSKRLAMCDQAEELLRKQLKMIEQKMQGMQEMRARFVNRLLKVESFRIKQEKREEPEDE